MAGLLRSVWDEPRPARPPARQWWDWALVAVVVAVAVIEGVLRPNLEFRVPSVILAVALAPTLLWRRTHPFLMVAIAFGVSGLAPIFTDGRPSDLYTLAYLLLLAFSLLRWGSGRDIALGTCVLLAKIVFWLAAGFSTASNSVAQVGFFVTVLAVGAALRYRARARARELDQARLLERERLARDLHDTVAHHVSAMAIRAQAGLAMAATQPEEIGRAHV